MRNETAKVLEYLGFAVDRDFEAYQQSPGVVSIKWLSAQPQPDSKAIDAAALELATAEQAKAVQKVESDTARDDAKRALAALDTIIASAPTATIVQLRTAVEQMARIQKHHILATLGR